MHYDYSKLEGRIKEKYGTQYRFARKIGMSERTLSLKLGGKREWKQKDIDITCKALALESADIPLYFFSPCVQNIEQEGGVYNEKTTLP